MPDPAPTLDPHDIKSEEALLGSILVAPAKAKSIKLDPEDFYKPSLGKVWAAAVKCANNGGADPVTVAAELERRGQLSDVGGRERLESLAFNVVRPGNAKAYAKRIKEKAELRAIRRSAQQVLEAVDAEDEPAIAQALSELGHPIRFVDLESGETVQDCPGCETEKAINKKLQDKYGAALGQISRLEGKQEKKARAHKHWEEIEAVFDWYKLATGHFKIQFKTDQFNQALPRWKEEARGGANPCKGVLQAICGIALHPSRTKYGAKEKAHDSWELMTRSQEKFIDFQERAPGETAQDWWPPLIAAIEGNLK